MTQNITPAMTLPLPEWAEKEGIVRLMNIIGGKETAPRSMFVGGCVRNTLMDISVTDVDIATQHTPEEIINLLAAEKIKVVATGIDHGTVTAVVEGQPFEITTLRHDVETDGRHASVEFTNDWLEDAKRRDFTINSLLMDMQGNVYDVLGSGIDDLNARHVVFVGDASRRVSEDYLRILRYFRFYAIYGEGKPDVEALRASHEHAAQIASLSKERVTQEVLKILAVKNAHEILQIMFDHNVLRGFADQNYKAGILQRLCLLQEKYDAIELMPRLFVLAGNKPSFFEDYLRLSHAQTKFIVKMEMAAHSVNYDDLSGLKKKIFYHGNDLLLQGYLFAAAAGKVAEDEDKANLIATWKAPECPITGETLIAEGFKTGPELGIELARRQEEWLEEQSF